jgi:hypothetical protein
MQIIAPDCQIYTVTWSSHYAEHVIAYIAYPGTGTEEDPIIIE